MRYALILFVFFTVYALTACTPERRVYGNFAWEAWPLEKTLDDMPLENARILRGDEKLDEGEPVEALESYVEARPEVSTLSEEEALVIRIASTQLALNRVDDSRQTLKEYFENNKISEHDLKPEFSLLYGFIFKKKGEKGQALAWFSQSLRNTSPGSVTGERARIAIEKIIMGMSEQEYNNARRKWAGDKYISPFFVE